MNILLTGGTGYLGSKLTARLIRSGHKITRIVRKPEQLGRLVPIEISEDEVSELHPEIVIHTACTYARGTNTINDIIDGNSVVTRAIPNYAIAVGCPARPK